MLYAVILCDLMIVRLGREGAYCAIEMTSRRCCGVRFDIVLIADQSGAELGRRKAALVSV